jgi:hypothetical protein
MSTLEQDDTPPASLALADDGGDLKVCVRRATASVVRWHIPTVIPTMIPTMTRTMTLTQVSRIAHAAIASLCVQCLSYPNAGRCTLTAMSVPPGIPTSTYSRFVAYLPLLYCDRHGPARWASSVSK